MDPTGVFPPRVWANVGVARRKALVCVCVVIEASQGIVGVVGFICVVLPAGFYEAPPIDE